jgi:hypothetical protein
MTRLGDSRAVGDTFYGVELITSAPVGVLPPILGSIEAWKGIDAGRRITFVRSRPDIIAYHLGGSTYFSNVEYLEADLRAMEGRAAEPGELRLLELRYVEQGRIPFGIFEPVTGWAIRDVIGFLQCEAPLAAAIALQIYRTYSGAANVVTPAGTLVREVLPHFNRIWRRETPSFTGIEPDISIAGRIREARQILASVGRTITSYDRHADTPESGAAFEAEMEALARDVELGPGLATLLARYSYTSPW